MSSSPLLDGCSRVRGVRLFEMRKAVEPDRGSLAVGEFCRDLPFQPCRFFLTFGVPDGVTRGNHAHRCCDQLVVCTHGVSYLHVDDGEQREVLLLNRPGIAAFVPRMIWTAVRLRSADSVLLVFASRMYEPEDYIRDYEEFRSIVRMEG